MNCARRGKASRGDKRKSMYKMDKQYSVSAEAAAAAALISFSIYTVRNL